MKVDFSRWKEPSSYAGAGVVMVAIGQALQSAGNWGDIATSAVIAVLGAIGILRKESNDR